ncbi:secretory lipase [Herbihabitans rhizosphaerae]|uniref:Secretory lipase n=1 Tax=Herbihabitans rhizosphaerae TaxID=1872711 RepID=A0A4Q7KJU5_9PSEU|nr:lipase family protein [Herbihabitans rhizosphaerae]RZS36466.1 secretory lipase [Herbihabitans rhizosphaerae]
MLRKLATGLCVVALGLGVAVAAHADDSPAAAQDERPPVPQNDSFYTPPSPLPDVPAGDVLRSREVTLYAEPFRVFPAPVKAHQVIYRSTSATGAPNAVSGTVIVPPTPWIGPGPRPVMAYALGTQGLGDQCAPSYQLRVGTEIEIAFLVQAMVKGWAVALTDYEGLGTPGTHTYATGVSSGRALLDVARAATRLPGAGIDPAAPIGVFGYSQGGQAAASAGEQHAGYAPELNVRGTATGGVPSDLNLVARSNNGGIGFGLVLGAAVGLSAAYPELGLDQALNAEGKKLAERVANACVAEMVVAAPFRRLNDFTTTPDVIDQPKWQKRLAENRLGTVKPSAPVYLYHGTIDELIPYSGAKELKARYCAVGTNLEWHSIPLGEHVLTVSVWGTNALNWLGDRFAGKPTKNSCAG